MSAPTPFGAAVLLQLIPRCPAQDPIIFSGTVRSNLDPFERAGSDLDVWEALRRASLMDYVSGLEVPLACVSPAVCLLSSCEPLVRF